MTPSPAIHVFLLIRDSHTGAGNWQRFVVIGTDHEAAVREAARNLKPGDVVAINSFDAEPRKWRLDSEIIELEL